MQNEEQKPRAATRTSPLAHGLHYRSPVTRADARGFTLIEMMIVVIIIGILATLAVVGYRKLVQSSHVSEATNMVQNIRVAQEAYHSETQQYANISTGFPNGSTPLSAGILFPVTPKYGFVAAWGSGAPPWCGSGVTCNQDWSVLPVHADGPLLFGYATTAGPPGVPNPTSVSVDGNTLNLPPSVSTDWYCIGAEADLDGNTANATDVFGFSWTNQIFVSNEGL